MALNVLQLSYVKQSRWRRWEHAIEFFLGGLIGAIWMLGLIGWLL